ncbi:MAG: hypothetical protein R2838_20660 [Caldilineaceae bacterium]
MTIYGESSWLNLLYGLLRNRPGLTSAGGIDRRLAAAAFLQAIVQAIQAAPTRSFSIWMTYNGQNRETLALLNSCCMASASTHSCWLAVSARKAGVNRALAAFIAYACVINYGSYTLAALGQEVGALAAQTAGEAITLEQARTTLSPPAGVRPLYLIEVVRSGFTEGSIPPRPGANGSEKRIDVPSMRRIRKLLSARLDQLSPSTRDVANMAAVVGRTFSYTILQAAVTHDEMALVGALDEVVTATNHP